MGINPKVLFLYGATGTGKTDLALALAQHIPAEIINMDIGSFYTPLTIGTAKPAWRNQIIPHHMFDIVDFPVNYTVTMYRAECLRLIDEIHLRGKTPIIVGGSGFYLKSLLFPPRGADEHNVVAQLDVDEGKTTQELWDQLHAIDSDRARAIDCNDIYRIKRALALWRQLGKKPSEYKPVFDFPYSFVLFHVYRPRAQLYMRINERVRAMIDAGWEQEVRSLCGTPWERFILDKKIIGYNDLIEYIQTNGNFKKIIEAIQQKTRLYAKRQITFWRMLERSVVHALQNQNSIQGIVDTIDLSLIESDLYATYLLSRINTLDTLK
jgi:tRNA dimethylallyltransferase